MKKVLLALLVIGCLAATGCTGSIEGRTSAGKKCESDFLLIPAISLPVYLDCKPL